jgi:hypothetical protein
MNRETSRESDFMSALRERQRIDTWAHSGAAEEAVLRRSWEVKCLTQFFFTAGKFAFTFQFCTNCA